ncbi:MAG: response regulator [Myxococcota bacterium]|nr:response regulator [Myxococcota bacterium]
MRSDGYGGQVPPGRVLIVDDDDDVRAATQEAMELRGYEVVAVGSGADALGFLTHDTPTIMLLDLHMDDMNGWEVLGAIRKNPRFAGVKVVVVTGSSAKVTAPVRVLRKPFKIDALIELLEGERTAVAS